VFGEPHVEILGKMTSPEEEGGYSLCRALIRPRVWLRDLEGLIGSAEF